MRCFAGVLLCCMLVFAVPSAGAEVSLRFASQDFPPFSYAENGTAAGPFADIVNMVCAEAGLTCSIAILPWGRALERVRQGDGDGLFPLGWNEERATWLRPSPPVLTTEYVLFASVDSGLKYETPDDLEGKRVGVYGPSNTSHELHKLWKRMRNFTIDMRPDSDSGFLKLPRHRVDFVFSNRDVGDAVIRKNSIAGVGYAGNYKTLDYLFGFSLAPEVQPDVDRFLEVLARMKKRGDVAKILGRYGLSPAP
ncbi:MAG: substrate-binding periplasmic protein [Halodesulfovibrio sp.]